MASHIDNDEDFVDNSNVDVVDTDVTDKKLMDDIINEPVVFNDLVLEADVNEIDEIESMCSHYIKYMDADDDIKEGFEYQFFECVCVIAYEHVSGGSTVKNEIKWDSLAKHFMNVIDNYPMKHWWREGILKFLPASKLPVGVLELAQRIRDSDKITKTWLKRNSKKTIGLSDDDVRTMYFGYKVETTAKLAITQVSMFYNSLYRKPGEELPSGTNNMSRLYRAMKKCLFEREKKAAYVESRKRAFGRRKDVQKGDSVSRAWLMDGFEKHMEKEFKSLIIEDYFPKHWLAFHLLSKPVEDRFPKESYVSMLIFVFMFDLIYNYILVFSLVSQ